MSVSLLLILCGCTQKSDNVKTNVNANMDNSPSSTTSNNNVKECNVEKIKYIIPEKIGNKTRFKFAFENSSGELVKVDGSVKLEIFDKFGNCVYNKTYDLNSVPYSSGKYMIVLDSNEIGKSIDDKGNVVLTYKNSGKILTKSHSIILQKYTEEELKNIFEEEYIKNAKTINKEQIGGNFKITITKHGYFKVYDAKKNKIKEVYRVDMIVKNLADENVEFNPMDIYIIDNSGNKYRYINGGNLEIGTILNGRKQIEGYFLFEDIPKDAKELRLQFRLGQIENGGGYNVFDFDLE